MQHCEPIIYIQGASEKRMTREEAERQRRQQPQRGNRPVRHVQNVRRAPPPIEDDDSDDEADLQPPNRNFQIAMRRAGVEAVAAPPPEVDLQTALVHFWTVVESLQWRNYSDGPIEKAQFSGWYGVIPPRNRQVFRKAYGHYHDIAMQQVSVKNCDRAEDLASHMVMMGKNFYEQCLDDNMWVQFLIDQNDYQRLHADIVGIVE